MRKVIYTIKTRKNDTKIVNTLNEAELVSTLTQNPYQVSLISINESNAIYNAERVAKIRAKKKKE